MILKVLTLNTQFGMAATSPLKMALYFWKSVLPHPATTFLHIGHYIRDNDIGIAAFQEIDGPGLRSNYINQLELIGLESTLEHYEFFPTFQLGEMISQGNGVLSRYPVVDSDIYELHGGWQQRLLCQVLLDAQGMPVNFFITHLTIGRHKQKQADYIAQIMRECHGPTILTGDFNTGDNLGPLEKLMRRAGNHATYPSWKPSREYDRIYYNTDLREIRSYATPQLFSDHLGIVAELAL